MDSKVLLFLKKFEICDGKKSRIAGKKNLGVSNYVVSSMFCLSKL